MARPDLKMLALCALLATATLASASPDLGLGSIPVLGPILSPAPTGPSVPSLPSLPTGPSVPSLPSSPTDPGLGLGSIPVIGPILSPPTGPSSPSTPTNPILALLQSLLPPGVLLPAYTGQCQEITPALLCEPVLGSILQPVLDLTLCDLVCQLLTCGKGTCPNNECACLPA